MINVTKSYLPPLEDYNSYLEKIWQSGWLTNNGVLLQELEAKLKSYLNVKHLFFCTNGTIAIQLAIKALRLNGSEIITTPFSYVATTNSILWENCIPIFVDINSQDFNINAELIESSITPNTKAILATHVYGSPCDVYLIESIAKRHNLKVIYDGAHCFGATLDGRQILSFGDISTCSFHATKLFQTVEGGCIITDDDELARQIYLARQFGHINDDYFSLGINGKNSEFHAAMGLCNLPMVPKLIQSRKSVFDVYMQILEGCADVYIPYSQFENFNYNYSYFPIVLPSEDLLLVIKDQLLESGVNTRRYFYPSLNNLPFVDYQSCPVSEDISMRVLALPMYHDLPSAKVVQICEIIVNCLENVSYRS